MITTQTPSTGADARAMSRPQPHLVIRPSWHRNPTPIALTAFFLALAITSLWLTGSSAWWNANFAPYEYATAAIALLCAPFPLINHRARRIELVDGRILLGSWEERQPTTVDPAAWGMAATRGISPGPAWRRPRVGSEVRSLGQRTLHSPMLAIPVNRIGFIDATPDGEILLCGRDRSPVVAVTGADWHGAPARRLADALDLASRGVWPRAVVDIGQPTR